MHHIHVQVINRYIHMANSAPLEKFFANLSALVFMNSGSMCFFTGKVCFSGVILFQQFICDLYLAEFSVKRSTVCQIAHLTSPAWCQSSLKQFCRCKVKLGLVSLTDETTRVLTFHYTDVSAQQCGVHGACCTQMTEDVSSPCLCSISPS